jgi:DNA-directed RNA polymerase specialized sigma24 family protein
VGRYNVQRRHTQRRRSSSVSDTLLLFGKTRERLARLSDDLRIALSLVVVDGLSYEEAAERLKIPQSTLFTRLALARESVGAMIASDEHRGAVAAE